MSRGAIERAAKITFFQNQKFKNRKIVRLRKGKTPRREFWKISAAKNGFRKMKTGENFSNRVEPRRVAIDPITEMAAWLWYLRLPYKSVH
jgi:hypothetical protein